MPRKKQVDKSNMFGQEPVKSMLEIKQGDTLMDSNSQIWEVVELLTLGDEMLLARKFGRKKQIWVKGAKIEEYWKTDKGD